MKKRARHSFALLAMLCLLAAGPARVRLDPAWAATGARGAAASQDGQPMAAQTLGEPRWCEPHCRYAFLPLALRCCDGPTGRWHTGTGLEGIMVYPVAVTDDALPPMYAGTAGHGVYTSRDRGLAWEASGVPGITIRMLLVDPADRETAYAATWGAGVQRTENAGGGWTAVNDGLQGHLWLYALAIDNSGEVLYAGTDDAGVYRGEYGSGSLEWVPASDGLDDLNIRSLVVAPGTAGGPRSQQVVYAGTAGSGIYKSTDGGAHWSAANSGIEGLKVWSLAVHPDDPEDLYAGTDSSGVYRSEDGGESWTPVEGLEGSTAYGLALDGRDPGTLYAGLRDGRVLVRSGEAPWQEITGNLGVAEVKRLVFVEEPCPALYAATTDGVWWAYR